jgi:hypothetical protein
MADIPVLPKLNPAIKLLRGVVTVGFVKTVDKKKMLCTVSIPGEGSAETERTIKISQPFVSLGWGILGLPEAGTAVLLLKEGKSYAMVGYATIPAFLPLFGLKQMGIGESYPNLDIGELAMQSKGGGLIHMFKKGSIKLATPTKVEMMLNELFGGLGIKAEQSYVSNDALMYAAGAVLRDYSKEGEENTADGSWDPRYDEIMEKVGYNPKVEASKIAFLLKEKQIQRNPAFAEVRMRIKEFADSYINYVREELQKDEAITDNYAVGENTIICDTREWAMCLGPNDLGEIILGTVVNTLGKVTDIEGNPIEIENEKLSTDDKKNLNTAGMVYVHFGTRGDKDGLSKRRIDQAQKDNNTEYEESKWHFGVTKEGLTKINIPASNVDTERNKPHVNRSVVFNADGSVESTFGTASGEDEDGNSKDALPIMTVTLGGKYDEQGELVKTQDLKNRKGAVQDSTVTNDIKDTEIYAQIKMASGTTLNIDKNGSVQLVVNKDTDIEVVRNKKETVGGDVETYVGGTIKNHTAGTVETVYDDKLKETVRKNVVKNYEKNETKKIGNFGKIECGQDFDMKAGRFITVAGKYAYLGDAKAKQPLVLGLKFLQYFNTHTHIGNLGAPTGPPPIAPSGPMTSAHLSKTVFTK